MRYLTIDEVCEMLSISRRTLERMRDPRSKIGKESELGSNFREILMGMTVDELKSSISPAGSRRERVYFPSPDLYIGSSPRWEQERLLSWLAENGHRL